MRKEEMLLPAAGEKALWELREALDTGRCLDLESPAVYCRQAP